jgi:hypothetical protein
MYHKMREGSKISFWGTTYTIDKVIEPDRVRVTMNNGVPISLWFPNLPGREVLEY